MRHTTLRKSLRRLTAPLAGFGNAGVHLCHGLSYPISGLNYSKGRYKHSGYEVDHPIVPVRLLVSRLDLSSQLTPSITRQHGISVALTGPAVFSFTAPSAPDRHRAAAEIFNEFEPDGIDTSRVSDADIGPLLHDRIARFLVGLDVPRGLSAIGYTSADNTDLVNGTLPQRRVLDLARECWLFALAVNADR